MKARSTRLAAIATLLCVTWTALWPAVSSAHALASADAMPLCHQAGMMVGADEPVPGGPAETPRKQHCPLCIMAFLALCPAAAIVPAQRIAPVDLARTFRDAVHPADLSARMPESRAPPSSPTVIPA